MTQQVTKGVLLREAVIIYEQWHGADKAHAAIDALPSELRTLLDPTRPGYGILPTQKYPLALVTALLDASVRGMSEAEKDDYAQKLGVATVKSLRFGIQKTFFRLLMKPDRYVKYAQQLWNLTWDSGEVSVEVLGPRHHVGTLRRWDAHHPLICRMAMYSKVQIYEAMGCREVKVTPERCLAWGHDHCSSSVQWQGGLTSHVDASDHG